ncbi:uncharacterized protein LOC116769742 [Danaus plexippus]|uniref:uncharacterized protein LOC116769742 n=1 Tax=Danaus plexippus TaxID=13037 RepID=UPI002AB26E73|nr:uncharacterized protein LOC116769742 [Danaus plexippus]
MEDTLGLQKAEDKQSTYGWQLVDDGDLSRTDVSHRLNRSHLQVITKHEIPSDRPAIPATFMEKLSFFRAYTSTLSKLELLCEQQNSVQRFLWFYVFNVLCKSLPMTYIYLFLSIYSPDQHLFLPKMAPLLYDQLADFDLLAESMTAPPVAHIIFSRSGDKVDPSLDSALINLSNSVFYISRATLSETIIIFWLYPMGRLVDDITFHFGVPPTRLRIWSLFVLPIFYSIKCYILIDTYLKMEFYEEMVNYKMWTFIIQSLVILFGAIYIFFYYIHKKKQVIS